MNIYDPEVEEEQIWNDLSEASPSIPIESSMFFRGGFGFYFWVLITFISIVKKQVTICHSAIEACKNAEAGVIATE